MPDHLREWLCEDHAALSAMLERAPLTDLVLARLSRRQRKERMVLGLAVMAGAGLAAWQLPTLKFLHLPSFGFAVPDVSLLAGALLIAITAAVFSWNLNEG